jgi:hypothetical protein
MPKDTVRNNKTKQTTTTPSQSHYYKHTNPSPYLKPYPSFCYPNLPPRNSQSEPCHPKLLSSTRRKHTSRTTPLPSFPARQKHAYMPPQTITRPASASRSMLTPHTNQPARRNARRNSAKGRVGADVGRIGSAGGYVGSVEPWERYGG